jgi:hypothetical protein
MEETAVVAGHDAINDVTLIWLGRILAVVMPKERRRAFRGLVRIQRSIEFNSTRQTSLGVTATTPRHAPKDWRTENKILWREKGEASEERSQKFTGALPEFGHSGYFKPPHSNSLHGVNPATDGAARQ